MGRFNSHLWVGIFIWVLGATLAIHLAQFIRGTFQLSKLVSLGIGILLAPCVLWLLNLILEKILNWMLRDYYAGLVKSNGQDKEGGKE